MAYRWLNVCCVGFLACSLTAVPAVSQGKGKGHNKHDGDDDGRGKGKKKAKHDFDSQDREVITSYYSGRGSNLPPGLAKRGGNLPPGLQKQLRRNGQLPPGLEKRLSYFPDDLDRRLPRLPAIYRRGTIGNRAVIVDTTTNLILDTIDIFGRR